MTKFTIKQEEISRIKLFSNYIKKLESISDIGENQLFHLTNDNKLHIYAIGPDGNSGSIHQEISIDVFDVSLDTNLKSHFVTDLDSLLVALSKITDIDIIFNLTSDKLSIVNTKKQSSFSMNLALNKSDEELTEVSTFIATQLALPEFDISNRIIIDITNIKDDLLNIASFIKCFDLNTNIEIDETSLKAADNFGIFKETLAAKPCTNTVLLHCDVIQLANHIDKIHLSSDQKFFYFDLASFGIKILFVKQVSPFVYPTDSDIEGFIPEASNRIKVEINAQDFYNTLEEFEGFFDSEWTYHQVYIRTPTDFSNVKKLELSWQDGIHEIKTNVSVNILERTDLNEDFSFLIPTKSLKVLRPILNKDKDSSITIEYNSLAVSQPHGSGIKISNNGGIELEIPKMLL
jgi:hypothetical protein